VINDLSYVKLFVYGICAVVVILVFAFFDGPSFDPEQPTGIDKASGNVISASLSARLADQPLRFIENQGQAGPDARFHVQGAGHTILFNENSIELRRVESKDERNELVLEFDGANQTPVIEGIDKLSGVNHFYVGSDPSGWRTNVPTYGAVIYRDLYPGIDMAYIGDEGSLESEFYLKPRADPSQIRLSYEGVKAISLGDDGTLILDTELGELVEKAPFAYQDIDGVRIEIEAQYVLLLDGSIGFDLGKYEDEHALVIDPELVFQVVYGTSVGLTSAEGVAIDSDGNVIFAGKSNLSFPVTDTIEASNDASISGLLMKLDGTTGEVMYSALFGGSKIDEFTGLTLDPAGNMYLSGVTASDDFPLMNAAQDTLAGGSDAFLVVLTPDAQLAYGTYLGGSDSDIGRDIAIDGAGNVFVAGITTSADFPTTAGAFQEKYVGGDPDAPWEGDNFVTKYNAAGGVDYATYLGGSGNEIVCGIAANASGLLTIAGVTESADFPLANAYQGTFGGGGSFEGDITVSRLNSSGNGLIYSTYVGGSRGDNCTGVALGPNDDIFVSGSTNSQDFPIVGGESTPEAGFTDGVLLMLEIGGQPVYSVRSNLTGDDEFVEVTVNDDDIASPIIAFADTLAILDKSRNGLLESVFAFESPRGRVFAAHAIGHYLVLAGDNAGPAGKAQATCHSNGPCGAMAAAIARGGAAFTVDKRLKDPSRRYVINDVVEWVVSITNTTTTPLDELVWSDSPGEGLSGGAVFLRQVPTIDGGQTWTSEIKTRMTGGKGGLARNSFLVRSPDGSLAANETVEINATLGEMLFAYLEFSAPIRNLGSHQSPIDVFVDSIRVTESLQPNTLSNPAQVEMWYVSPTVEIVAAGAEHNSNPIASASFDLGVEISEDETRLSDLTQYILSQISADSISILAKLDARLEASEAGSVEFFMANSTDAPFDVVLLSGSTGKSTNELIIDDLMPGSTSDYVAVDPGLHQIELRSEDGSESLVTFEFDWFDSGGDAVAVVTAGGSESIRARGMAGDGTISDPKVVSSAESGSELPTAFRILDNYPNPFNPSTTIRYELAGRTNVTVAIYDIAGHRVRTLINNEVPAGRYDVVWDGRNEGSTPVASGTYIVRLETEGGFSSRRLALVK
jgi:hypothetical protein